MNPTWCAVCGKRCNVACGYCSQHCESHYTVAVFLSDVRSLGEITYPWAVLIAAQPDSAHFPISTKKKTDGNGGTDAMTVHGRPETNPRNPITLNITLGLISVQPRYQRKMIWMPIAASELEFRFSCSPSTASDTEYLDFYSWSSSTECNFTVPASPSFIDWAFGCWQSFMNGPDYKEFCNNLHLKVYRKTRFIKKILKLPSEHKRPITNRMMLQRATFNGKMSRL